MNEDKPMPEGWEKLCDDVAEEAAKKLGCAVVLVALQTVEQGGKVAAAHGGIKDTTHPLAKIIDSPARLLGTLAAACAMEEGLLQPPDGFEVPPPGGPMKVQYVPGFADNLNLPPEELADLKNHIEGLAASGQLLSLAQPLSAEEAEEIERLEEEHLRARGSSSTPQ